MDNNNIPPSFLKLAFSLNRPMIAQTLNNVIPEELYNNTTDAEGDQFHIRALKSGDIDVNAAGNTFYCKAPVRLHISKAIPLTKAEAECSILFDFESTLDFEEDWTLLSKTKLKTFEWLEKPSFTVGSFSLPLEKIVLHFIQNNSAFLCEFIDHKIKTDLKLGDFIKQTTTQLPNPFPIHAKHKIWWQITPTNSFLPPIQNEASDIKGVLGVKSKLAIGIGTPISTVPFLIFAPQPVEALSPDSALIIPLRIAYKTLDFLLNSNFAKQDFKVGRFTIQLNHIQTAKSQHRLSLKAQLSGSFQGTAHLLFRPMFDPIKKELILAEIGLKIKGSNFKTKIIAGVFQGLIEDQLEKNNRFRIKDLLKGLNQQMEKIELPQGLVLSIKLEDVVIEGFKLLEAYADLRLHTRGVLALQG